MSHLFVPALRWLMRSFVTALFIGVVPAPCLLANTALPAGTTVLEAKPLPAAVTPARTTRPLTWPVLGRQLGIRLVTRIAEWDGMPVNYAEMQVANRRLRWRIDDLDYWFRRDAASGRHALEFTYHWNERVYCGLAALPRRQGQFAGLDDATWHAYRSSLATDPSCRILTDDDSAVSPALLQVLGERTRVIDYWQSDADETEPAQRTVEVWVERPDHLLVFRVTGPADAVPGALPAFANLVINLEAVD